MPRAFITGITGQDGSYLAELLLAKGYTIAGLVRRLSQPNYDRISHLLEDITLIQGDLLDQASLSHALELAQPDEIYNLAAQSHVGLSFEQPVATGEYTGIGCMRLLEALRLSGGKARFYQASTSELFGNAPESPQNEATPFHPRSPYAIAKLYAHHAVVSYRASYGMFACCGILFNHESPRRGLDFVTRKITQGVARIKYGLQDYLELGNLHSCRDWGYAGDYVEAMWRMLQQPYANEYVIATGERHSVKEFLELACKYAGIDPKKHVREKSALFRANEVHRLVGDASKARVKLGWEPCVRFEQLVELMVEHDIKEVINGKQIQREIGRAHV